MQPQINFLSQEEQEQIHQAALWLLSNVGMRMPSQEAVDIMQKAGAKIEGENIIKVPAELVEQAVETAPKRKGFVLYGREEKYDIHFDTDTPFISSMQEATHVIDIETRQRRPATDRDLADMVRLMDALENVGIIASLITPQDVTKETAEWYALATMLKNTSKHIFSACPGAGFVRDAVAMGSLAAGGEKEFQRRPFIQFGVLTRPPFQISRLEVEALIEISRQGLPTRLAAGVIAGVTAPQTLAGTVAQAHAEILTCLVLSQLVRPGTPIMYSCTARTFDMKTANVAMSSPESAIMRGAQMQMAQYLGLPMNVMGSLRDAKVLDAQAGFETGMVGLIAALRSDGITSLQFDMDTLVDFSDLIFTNEALGALKRVAKGFSVDEYTLALDIMREVGHGGSFLGSKHTLQNFRKELWIPRLFDHHAWPEWEKAGGKDIEQRARERAKVILASHQPERLDPRVEAEIDRIAREATIDYTKSI